MTRHTTRIALLGCLFALALTTSAQAANVISGTAVVTTYSSPLEASGPRGLDQAVWAFDSMGNFIVVNPQRQVISSGRWARTKNGTINFSGTGTYQLSGSMSTSRNGVVVNGSFQANRSLFSAWGSTFGTFSSLLR